MKLIGLLGNDRMLKIAGFEKIALPPAVQGMLTSKVRAGGPDAARASNIQQRFRAQQNDPVTYVKDIARGRYGKAPEVFVGSTAARPAAPTPTTSTTPTPTPAAPASEASPKSGVIRRTADAIPAVVGAGVAAPFNALGWAAEHTPGVRHLTPGFRALRDPATAGNLADLRSKRMGGVSGILPHIVGLSPFHTALAGAALGGLFADKDEGTMAGALRGAAIGGLGGYGLTRWRDSALRNEAGFYGGPQAVRKALAAGQVPQATRPLPPPRVQSEPENALQ